MIGIDIVLSSISSKLTPKALGLPDNKGVEAYVFHKSGEVIASNIPMKIANDNVFSSTMALTQQEQNLVSSKPPLLVSNQLDWRPYDYSRAGEPQGYSVDLVKLLSEKNRVGV
ncbi:hypothetical protein QW180_00790 [Vibrio sinaloensis]|nr:hypothetical protein [Vibrio sinaloensis]